MRNARLNSAASVRGASRVDHIQPRRTVPFLAVDPTNLRTLCRLHNAQAHREKGAKISGGGPGGTARAPDQKLREPSTGPPCH
jgi:hypothetical protein